MRRPAVLAAVLIAAGPAAAEQADVAAGRALAVQLCSGCHLVAAGQRSPMAVGAPTFAQIADDPANTEFRLRNVLRTPHPVMPMLILTPEETESVVAFVRSLRSR